MTEFSLEQIEIQFAFLQAAPAAFKRQFHNRTTQVHLEAGSQLAQEGSQCEHLALILNGTVRVYKLAENGRELTLYRIGAGESCVLNTSCVLGMGHFPALARIETDARVLIVQATDARSWLTSSPEWRHFVFGLIAKRLTEVIALVEEVAFRKMDQRLCVFLVENAQDLKIRHTHQELADELGTAREVISRLLKNFADNGWLHQQRKEIILSDLIALEGYAHNP